MKIAITVYPIDSSLLKDLSIYDDAIVDKLKVGTVLNSLFEHGYTRVQSNYNSEIKRVELHCTKR